MSTYIPFTSNDTAIVLVDHQPGVLAMVGSLPTPLVTNNAATLARLGEELNLPLVITSTRENLKFLGTTLPEIQAAAPKAYENRVRRAGTLNAFDDPAFVEAVAATNRQNLVRRRRRHPIHATVSRPGNKGRVNVGALLTACLASLAVGLAGELSWR